MITLDTSFLLSLTDRKEQHFQAAVDVLRSNRPPFIIPIAIMSEITYLIEDRLGHHHLETFLDDVESHRYSLDIGDSDLPRIIALVRRYRDLRLGYADAAVIACAERNGRRVATFDLRHFSVVAREGTIEIVP